MRVEGCGIGIALVGYIAVLTIIALALVHGITALAISWPKNVWRRHWSGCVAINY
jgi:hypothetical protein